MSKPRLMLLGESWRQRYEAEAKRLLENDFDIWTPGSENCRFAAYTLHSLRMYLDAFPSPDIVFWNNGMWDTAVLYAEDGSFTPLDSYLETLEKIVREIRRAGAVPVFAATGAVRDEAALRTGPLPAKQDNRIISDYNRAAKGLMARLDVAVCDIYDVIYPLRERYICDDFGHPNEEGARVCAALVAETVRNVYREKVPHI